MSDPMPGRLERAKTLRNLGELARRQPGDGARAAYEQAVALLREEEEPLLLAHTLRHLGDVHHEEGRPELAAPCYDEALALYRSHPAAPPLDLANAIRSQAILRHEAGDSGEAASLWEEARRLYATAEIAAGVAESVEQLARLARRAESLGS